jgi:hypothetical protein
MPTDAQHNPMNKTRNSLQTFITTNIVDLS